MTTIISDIKGAGNASQQDRVGSFFGTTPDGVQTGVMWVLDGHGKNAPGSKDIGGECASIGNAILSDLTPAEIETLYNSTFEGSRLYSHIQDSIIEFKHGKLTANGWSRCTHLDGTLQRGIWNRRRQLKVNTGGTTLILIAMIKVDDSWRARLYNVGDSLMVFKNRVYSQAGIDGLNDTTVRALWEEGSSTVYSRVNRRGPYISFHEESPEGDISCVPMPYRGQTPQGFHATVRGDAALAILKEHTWASDGFRDVSERSELASWSNLGDTALPKFSSVPSYSETFIVDGPLSLTSDGIGDILEVEGDISPDAKVGWFLYPDGHPMKDSDPSKCAIFANSWFHSTIAVEQAKPCVSSSDDPFYKKATDLFGIADNISRITFTP